MLTANPRKLAKLNELRDEVEQERQEEEETGEKRMKSMVERVPGLQPFGKLGWMHRRAKAQVKEHA